MTILLGALGGLFGLMVLFATMVIGLVAVDGGRYSLKRDPGLSMAGSRDQTANGPAFAPLDLGESTVRWPSELPSDRRPVQPMPWPSETWTDDFFDRGGKKRQTAGAVPSDRWTETEAASHLPRAPQEPKAKPQPAKPKQAQAPKQQPPQKAKQQAPKAVARPPARNEGTISDADVIAAVEQKGLAAAVEFVRERTGWEFQKAAQHIARVLRARRES